MLMAPTDGGLNCDPVKPLSVIMFLASLTISEFCLSRSIPVRQALRAASLRMLLTIMARPSSNMPMRIMAMKGTTRANSTAALPLLRFAQVAPGRFLFKSFTTINPLASIDSYFNSSDPQPVGAGPPHVGENSFVALGTGAVQREPMGGE